MDDLLEGNMLMDSNLRFENYDAESSRFAYSAALAVAQYPGASYNPLFLYGDPEKSRHIMNAIGNYVINMNPEMIIKCISQELLECGDIKDNQSIEHLYSNADILMISDMQKIISESEQEKIFGIIRIFMREGKQIVVSSDCPTNAMNVVDKRNIRSLEIGMIVDV